MNEKGALERLDQLMIKYLRVPKDHRLEDNDQVSDFAADWRIVDLGMMVETEFEIPMSADKALSLRTVRDWRALLGSSPQVRNPK